MFELGSGVRNKLSGLVGVATARSVWLYGAPCYLVESHYLDVPGKTGEGVWVDEHRLECADYAYADKVEAVRPKVHDIGCGDIVRDELTGFNGCVTGITDYLNGETLVTVQPLELRKGRPMPSRNFHAARLVVVEA